MKNQLLVMGGILLAASVGCRQISSRSVPFTISHEQFVAGDSIVVEQVIAPASQLAIGDIVLVRGSYSLRSQPRAMLALFLTTTGPSETTPVSADQRMQVAAGSGRFELREVISAQGSLHVSFYPAESGSSFGEVYFTSGKP